MTTCFLAPDPIQSTQFIPGGNTPANGGQLFFYAAGSSTKQTVYKDNAAAVAWTNPIVLDSGGNLPSGGEVWFPTGQTFKVVFAPSNDTDPPASPYWTKDNLAGMNDVSVTAQSEWVSGPAPTFVSSTQFTLAGDQTGTFTVGRRLKTTNTAGTVYSTITSVSFSVNTTTVNVVSDGAGALDAGLSAVSYGIFDPANPSISASEVNRKGANVASAGNGTTNIWSVAGDYVHITGTNNIRHFSTAPYAGAMKEIVFDGSLTVFSSATFNIPFGLNITTSPNDSVKVRAETVSTYLFESYQGANGPLVSTQAANLFYASGTSAAQPPSFRTGSAADGMTWQLLDTQTAASSASLICSTGIGGANYDVYAFLINQLSGSALMQPWVDLSSSQGASFDTGAGSYQYGLHYVDSATSTGVVQSTDTHIGISEPSAGVMNAASTGGFNGVVYLYNSNKSTVRKHLTWVADYAEPNGGVVVACSVRGAADGVSASTIANAITAVRFRPSTGNFNVGTIRVFGLRNA